MTAGSDRRVRFSSFGFERLPGGRCRASVVLEHPDGTQVTEVVETTSATGAMSELRCAAQATLAGLGKMVGDRCSFSLLGVKAIKAFGSEVIIVALSAREDDEVHRLVGSVLVEDNPGRGAALSVLSATNRFLGRVLFGR